MTVPLQLEKLKSPDPKVKYGYAKELLKWGEEDPERLYPYYDHWLELLKDDNKILKWTAVDILGYVSAVDDQNKTENILQDLFDLLYSGELILCSHAIFALGQVARNFPEKRNLILTRIANITGAEFKTPACRAIAYGKALDVFKSFITEAYDNDSVLALIESARHAELKSTVKKANQLISRMEKLPA